MKRDLAQRFLQRHGERQAADSATGATRDSWVYFPLGMVAVMGLSLTILLSIQSFSWEKNQAEITFQEASQERLLVVQREITQALDIVQDLASFFEASAVVGRRDFRKFVGPVLKRHSGIQSLQWIPVVTAERRAEFIADAQRSFPPFQITELDGFGGLVEGRARALSYPVLYIQPYSTNKTTLGMDMATDRVVATQLQQAEITGTPSVSPAFFLDQEADARTVVAVTIPVFSEEEETDEAEDILPTEIRGFAVGVFFVGELVERGLANLRPGGIDLSFYQYRQGSNGPLIHRHLSRLRDGGSPGDDASVSQLRFSEQLLFGNQRWDALTSPAPGEFTIQSRNSWIILAGGLAFTALLAVYLRTLIGRERQVRREVDVRTSQLWETVQDLNREVAVRKSAEQELQSLNETLEQHIARRTAEADRRAQYLEQFAYVTSHDLKAPLRAVSNLAEWIEEDLADKLDDASREQLALLRDRVQRMHNLIEGLLEYSRVGRTSDSEKNVDTRELISEIVDSLSPPKGFKIKIQGEMPTLYVDRLQLGQVFSNLIGNALKHHGGEKGKIRIACESYPEGCKFSVCDDGKGIDPRYHDKVFMMFQTLAFGDFENSTGIGLALVKKIIEENGGTIRLDSDVGKGACFYFTWPTKRPPEKRPEK